MKAPILALSLLATTLIFPAQAALVAHWPLDTNPLDTSGGGHNGAVVGNTVAFGAAGAKPGTGSAATFTGNGHITVPWAAELNPGAKAPDGSGSFTIALWARPSVVGGSHRSPFTSREDSDSVNGPIIYIEPDRSWAYWAGNNGPSGAWNPIKTTAATANVWTHVVISYDAPTTTRKMYLDGVEVINQVQGVSANSVRNFHIGGGADDGNSFTWAGQIDDVGMWDNALTEAEIQNVMNNGVDSGPVIPDPRLRVTTPVILPLNGATQQFDLPITNAGLTKPLTISATSFSGADAAKFSVVTTPGSIAPGATANLVVKFIPAGATGAIEAVLKITSNDSADKDRLVTLKGAIYDPQALPDPLLDFGKLPAGSAPKSANLVIKNGGGSKILHLDAVNVIGSGAAHFKVTNFPATLAAGASGNIAVTFDRLQKDGFFSAQLEILTDDALLPTARVSVKAEVAFTNPLVAWWPLDTDASDASGNGYNGTLVNEVIFGQPGANAATGASALFDGSGHIDVPYDPNLNPGGQGPDAAGSFTVTLWALPTDNDANYHSPFTSREESAGKVNGPIIYNTFNGRWQYWAGNNGPSGAWNSFDGGPVIGDTWVHVAISYDADTKTRKMFLDGLVVLTQVLGISANAVRDLHIGGGADSGNEFRWIGQLDDVGLFRKALSDTEVQKVMISGVGSLTAPLPTPDFAISSITRGPVAGQVTLAWPSASGKNYRVQRSPNMATDWVDLNATPIPGTGSSLSYTDTALPANTTKVYYRIRTVP